MAKNPLFSQQDLFVSGADGYDTYRIPSIVVTREGTMLAFCEGRRHSRSDTGDIDLLIKRSVDGARTWSDQQVVWGDRGNTCGNPCPVVDQDTSTVWLLMTHNLGTDTEPMIVAGEIQGTRTPWVANSSDDGKSWSTPQEISETTKKANWTWYATGPGAGLQLPGGRLMIPCDHIEAGTREIGSHIIYSDDHGATWRLGGTVPTKGVNECEVVALSDGKLLLNMRTCDQDNKKRMISYSEDAGMSWSVASTDDALIEPICQGSIRRMAVPGGVEPAVILFSNPASLDRKNLTVRLSYDDCRTWPVARQVHAGPSAYSCLVVFPDETIGCLYERGDALAYEKITLARFDLEWLRN